VEVEVEVEEKDGFGARQVTCRKVARRGMTVWEDEGGVSLSRETSNIMRSDAPVGRNEE